MQTNENEGDLLAGVDIEDSRSPHRLIASDRVEGTEVFNRAGEKIGTVKRFLVEKRSGRAEYAEMEFGGFLGIGANVHPIPWELLDYEPKAGGYVVDLTKDQLTRAPHYAETERRPIDDVLDAQLRNHYGLTPIL